VVLFATRDRYLCNIEPSITSRIAAMAAPTPIPALAPVESPEWESSGDDAAGVDVLEGTDNCAREVGLYTGVT
jgi:hypothetical protein